MAAITFKGEELIAKKQAAKEVMEIDQIVLANIPGLDPTKPVDRNEQLPSADKISLQAPVSQSGYINPNLVVYSLMLTTGGKSFDFNWIGLYSSKSKVVVAISYLPVQTKSPQVAMTRNFMIEYSGAKETGDIKIDAKSWQVDFSARMNGIDERGRLLREDIFGRQIFCGDTCKVTKDSSGYYNLSKGPAGIVAGIKFSFAGKRVLIESFPNKVWLDVSQQGNALSDVQPVVEIIVSNDDKTDYKDAQGIQHYCVKIASVDSIDIDDHRIINSAALSGVTHMTMEDAVLDKNQYRYYISLAEPKACFRRAKDKGEYDLFVKGTRFIDNAGNKWVRDIQRATLDIESLGYITIETINDSITLMNRLGGGVVEFPPVLVKISKAIIPKANVLLVAKSKPVIIQLADSANSNIVESHRFDELYNKKAYTITDDKEMTLDYGFKGFIFDGNITKQNGQHYGVKLYGRRLTFKNIVITDIKGVGLWTALRGTHKNPYTHADSKTPSSIDQIEIINCEKEPWIFEGPSDLPIGHFVINESGDKSATTAQTSTHFPGEEIHGFRMMTAATIYTANINGIRFGRGIYVNDRIVANSIICSGCWGNYYATQKAFGTIDSLITQANPHSWGGVTKPSIENLSNNLLYGKVIAMRIKGQDQSKAPLVVDSGGAQWNNLRNRQSLDELGVFFIVDASGVKATIKAVGADTALITTKKMNNAHISCQFSNCNTVWENKKYSAKGAFDFNGSLETSQVFAKGVDAPPRVDAESLNNARIEYNQNGKYFSNNCLIKESVNLNSKTVQVKKIKHGMWRTPLIEDIVLTMRASGYTAPPSNVDLWVNGFDSTHITVYFKANVAAVGVDSVGHVVCKV